MAENLDYDEDTDFLDDEETGPSPDDAAPRAGGSETEKTRRAKTADDGGRSKAALSAVSPRSKWFFRLVAGAKGSVAAQKAMGSEKPKERLVRHGKGQKQSLSIKDRLRAMWRMIVALLPYLAPYVAYRIWGDGQESFVEYLQDHLALVLFPVLPLWAALRYTLANYSRTHPRQPQKGPRKLPQPPLPPTHQHSRDISDIVANLDNPFLRLFYLGLLGGATYVAGDLYPLTVEMFRDLPSDFEENLRPLALPILAPIVAFAIPRWRCAFVIRQRWAEIEECYTVAKTTLGYPNKLPRNPTSRQVRINTPWLAVQVEKWSALYEIDRFFVLAPEDLSVQDLKKWDAFSANLTAKLPRPEEWRVKRDPKGRGAQVGPANYPTAILWDGEIDPDPLTFYVGVDLDSGENRMLTLGEASSHVVGSGATSSGKTSFAEIICAQNLVTPMPWDETQHGIVFILDPKGPLANRWQGRPGVIVANGNITSQVPNDDGDLEPGHRVLANGMRWLLEEQARREAVLARYRDVATWVHLPDDVKREERLVPILIVSDEHLEHTAKQASLGDEEIEAENDDHAFIHGKATQQMQRVRNVGMHYIVIGQRANMTEFGARLMTNAAVRYITGQIDSTQLRTMFGDREDIPSLPSTRRVFKNGVEKIATIPGRARVMNAGGQDVYKIQVPWFGGDTNSETLDKWLPRGEVPLNGDFTPGAGSPRTAADFENAESLEEVEAEPEGRPEVAPPPASENEHEEALPEETAEDQEDVSWVMTEGQDDEAVFPMAEAEATRCSADGCVNDADRECPSCGKPVCDYDLSVPDSDGDMLCPSCAQEHPLAKYGLTDVYRRLRDVSKEYGLVYSYSIKDSEELTGVFVTLRTPETKKVIEVFGDGERVLARTASGQVEGEDEVLDRAEMAAQAYQMKASAQESA